LYALRSLHAEMVTLGIATSLILTLVFDTIVSSWYKTTWLSIGLKSREQSETVVPIEPIRTLKGARRAPSNYTRSLSRRRNSRSHIFVAPYLGLEAIR